MTSDKGIQFTLFDTTIGPENAPATDASQAVEPPGSAKPHARSPAALELCVLGSGSGGNCSALRWRQHLFLIDLGFGPATITRRLLQAGADLQQVRGVVLTHLDQDHFRPHWISTLIGWRIPVFLHRWHRPDFDRLPRAAQMLDAGLVHTFDESPFELTASLTAAGQLDPPDAVHVAPIRLAHDRQGTTGFVLKTHAGSVGYATDLGHVPPTLVEAFASVDIIAIESNYDPPMQLKSPRPAFLKRRIMGPAGHLSNQESFEAVKAMLDLSPCGGPRHIVLLHRSQQCNDPRIVEEVFSRDPRIPPRLSLTHQRRRSRWFKAAPPRQPQVAAKTAMAANDALQLQLGF